ncbi:MAG: ATP-binding protein [Bdellovibrionaceae bacterium]|nr:ATP-binding protein [Pseudobdellovibrionaceae bacterium]MDW8190930.1 ATP-binding protein [Pseudobdellovibrionaceae bacterium]
MDLDKAAKEKRKRTLELWAILGLGLFFILLAWFEIRLFVVAQELPFVHSIFFFGLVNFNIVLLLFLLFLTFKNLIKIFIEKKSRVLGSSLKVKLTVAFLAFAIVPTFLVFISNSTYVNASFEKWFSSKVSNILKTSVELSQLFYFNEKKRNYHYAHLIKKKIEKDHNIPQIIQNLKKYQQEFLIDMIEFYPFPIMSETKRHVLRRETQIVPELPPLSQELLKKFQSHPERSSQIEASPSGNFIRVIEPVPPRGLFTVTSYVPLSVASKINDVNKVIQEFKESDPIQYPLKSIYTTILVLISLVIIFSAIWFAFYLANQMSQPLILLGEATQKIAKGLYEKINVHSGSAEIQSLIENFNKMNEILAKSQAQLQQAMNELDRKNRYNNEILRSISTGVLSVDHNGRITTINRHAGELLHINPDQWIGKPVRDLLRLEYFRTFAELVKMMNEHRVGHLHKEIRVNINGETIPLLLQLNILTSETGDEIGKLAVFNDLTPIIQAQRAAAWREVARRIAHEIKNPLTPIKLSAERLLKKFGSTIKDESFASSIKMIIQQTEELKTMVNEFSQFARLPETKMNLNDLHEVIQNSLVLYQNSYKNVQFQLELDPKLPRFLFDAEAMKRVLSNLIDNAIAAVQKVNQPYITIKTQFFSELNIVRLMVIDNGTGIPQEQKQMVFDPYFTTKKEGTGLGLAIVKRIIEDHNGFIRIQDNVPSGTVFIIELPRF